MISRCISRRSHPTHIAAFRHPPPRPFDPRHLCYSRQPNTNLPQYAKKNIVSTSRLEELRTKFYKPSPQESKKMEVTSIADLKRIGRDELAEQLLQSQTVVAESTSDTAKQEKIAIVDVRDSDYIGGHLVGCLHRPSSTFSTKLDSLIEELKDHDKIVFHCALSQQRGPSAALKYIREKKALEARKRVASSEEDELLYKNVGKKVDQEVYVLDGGFVEWQQKYGNDERLTEGWREEIWEEY
ncbi:uncharacterized protein DFL_003462 [Arthrobotrys flagrans]|uniref:Rhodanese domain-containing protein n=1 Tax=Arthrobotrys flagrans TaxID=97331 RepID=A0A437A1X5_ARTFL|nr:hypothetical protein DFL_003462 [Arthrobotrys flagrans]